MIWNNNSAYARRRNKKRNGRKSNNRNSNSYARKYALNGLFNIDDTKDADTDEYTKRTKEEPTNDLKTIPISQERLDTINDLIIETNTDFKKFCAFHKISSLKDINVGNAQAIETSLLDKKRKMSE